MPVPAYPVPGGFAISNHAKVKERGSVRLEIYDSARGIFFFYLNAVTRWSLRIMFAHDGARGQLWVFKSLHNPPLGVAGFSMMQTMFRRVQ